LRRKKTMKKTIIITVLGIMLIANALALYGGESETFATNMTDPVYTVVGNSSDLEGMNVTFENGEITISLAQNYKPDNYSLVFFDNVTYEVEKIIYRGGGTRTRTKYVDRNVTTLVPTYIDNIVEGECSDPICLYPEDTEEEVSVEPINSTQPVPGMSDGMKWIIALALLGVIFTILFVVWKMAK